MEKKIKLKGCTLSIVTSSERAFTAYIDLSDTEFVLTSNGQGRICEKFPYDSKDEKPIEDSDIAEAVTLVRDFVEQYK